ncbi:solute carrier family 66 member 3 [Phlebotomus argentipes]|uniref:solute carrier family 66 member 3 n=1 Tax=Phlebotomus argentipes TaxID=94469 RepID=UPI002892D0DB|nr:solute carrier family 66 member 3 [Phlebotomus argentipes]
MEQEIDLDDWNGPHIDLPSQQSEVFQHVNVVQATSDFLSAITIATCLVSKVPQIRRIANMKSTEGISTKALILEVCSYTVTFSYNFCKQYALMSYMEYPILLLQEYVLILLVLKYQNLLNRKTFIFIGLYTLCTVMFLTKILPMWLLTVLLPLTTPVGATSKVIQLMEILRTKNSESVSLMTWLLSSFTNCTRIFTILMDSADYMLLMNFTISFFLSFAVFSTANHYKGYKLSKID